MVTLDKAIVAVVKVVQSTLPSVKIIRIDARDGNDSDGLRSLFITVVIDKRPLNPRELARKSNDIVGQLRTWLTEQDDDRFPYFDLLTEQDEQELQNAV